MFIRLKITQQHNQKSFQTLLLFWDVCVYQCEYFVGKQLHCLKVGNFQMTLKRKCIPTYFLAFIIAEVIVHVCDKE